MTKIRKNKSQLSLIGSVLIFVALTIFTFYHLNEYATNKYEEQQVDDYINKTVDTTIDTQKINTENQDESSNKTNEEYNYIGVLEIPKLNLKRGFLDSNDKNNNVNKNIQVLQHSTMPNVENGLLVIAGHSGNARVSFFRNLDKLKEKDLIYIYYKNIKYIYEVQNYYEEQKDGDISISKADGSILILTTCSPTHNDKQLVVNSKLINKENY